MSLAFTQSLSVSALELDAYNHMKLDQSMYDRSIGPSVGGLVASEFDKHASDMSCFRTIRDNPSFYYASAARIACTDTEKVQTYIRLEGVVTRKIGRMVKTWLIGT